MGKKTIRDQVYTTRAEFLTAATEAQDQCAALGVNFWDIVLDNLAVMTDEESGEQYAAFGPDENNAPTYALDKLGAHVGLVIQWAESTHDIPQAQGGPLARPAAIYCIAMPTIDQIKDNNQLAAYLTEVINKDLLTKSRKVARAHALDSAANPLTHDPVATLLAAAASRGGDVREKAYKAMFPILQAAFLKQVEAFAANLENAGRKAEASTLKATFSKARFSFNTVMECLKSQEAATVHFPSMKPAQWENLLKFAIAAAPLHKVKRAQRDADGNAIKGIDGKVVYDTVAAPVPSVFFQALLETRDETKLDAQQAPSFDFSEMAAAQAIAS